MKYKRNYELFITVAFHTPFLLFSLAIEKAVARVSVEATRERLHKEFTIVLLIINFKHSMQGETKDVD